MIRRPTVVVGAGVAGLVAARRLSVDREVIVLDKGRGLGGRVSTRRGDGVAFDHGAQFMTARTEWFAALIDAAVSEDVVREWFRGTVDADGPRGDGHPRWCGVGGMNSFAKHLAQGLDVRSSTRVVAVAVDGDGWVVRVDDGTFAAEAVVLTPPVPQTLELLAAGGTHLGADDGAALRAVEYEPCTAVMVALREPFAPLLDGPRAFADGPLAWAADNGQKGTSVGSALTLHGSAAQSAATWDQPDHEIADALIAALGLDPQVVIGVPQVHRWRFARPLRAHVAEHLLLAALPPAVLAGDGFGGGLVEGAARSGWSAAGALAASVANIGASMRPNS